jgi:hypothetical protein
MPQDPNLMYDQYGNPIGSRISPSMLRQVMPPNVNLNIQPALATLGQQQELAKLPEYPQYGDPQFRQGKLRTILNAIAGGLAGASGGPQAGILAGQTLRDMPYTQALQRYQSQVAPILERQRIEQEQQERAAKEYQLQTGRVGATSLAGYRESEEERKLRETGIKAGDLERKNRLAANRIDHVNYMMTHPKNPMEFLSGVDFSDPEAVAHAQETIEMYRQFTRAAPPWWQDYISASPEKKKEMDAAFQARAASTAKGQVQVLGTPFQRAEASAGGHEVGPSKAVAGMTDKEKADYEEYQRIKEQQKSEQTAATTAARIETEKKEASKLANNLADQVIKDPDKAWDIYKLVPAAGREEFIAKITSEMKGRIPRHLDPIEQRAATGATTAKIHAGWLINALSSPTLQARIGPYKGRLTALNQRIGTQVFDKETKEEQEARKGEVKRYDIMQGLDPRSEEAMFLDLIKYLVLFEATSVSGTRPSWQLINFLSSTQGPEFDLQGSLANLHASQQASDMRLKGLYQPSKEGQPVTPKIKFEVIK